MELHEIQFVQIISILNVAAIQWKCKHIYTRKQEAAVQSFSRSRVTPYMTVTECFIKCGTQILHPDDRNINFL